MKNLRNSGRFEMNKKGNIFLAHNRSYILSNKKCDYNLLNNRLLKKKSITMGNDVETSKLL